MASVFLPVFLKVLRDRSARDKLYKSVQYTIKIFLETSKRYNFTHDSFPYLLRIVKRLGQARSLFRFLLFLGITESLPKAITSLQVGGGSIVSIEPLITAMSQFGTDVFDSISCTHDVLGTGGRLRAAWWSCACWMVGIIVSIIKQSATLYITHKKLAIAQRAPAPTPASPSIGDSKPAAQPVAAAGPKIEELQKQKQDALIALIKAIADCGHASSILFERLGKYKVTACWFGWTGGAVGLYQSIQKLK